MSAAGFVTRSARSRRHLRAADYVQADTATPSSGADRNSGVEASFVTRRHRSRRHLTLTPVYWAVRDTDKPVFAPPSAKRVAFVRQPLSTAIAPVFPKTPAVADLPQLFRLPPTQFGRRHLTADTTATLTADVVIPPLPDTFTLGKDFITRSHRRRHALTVPRLDIDPQPVPALYPSFVPFPTLSSHYRAALLKLPELNEWPASPAVAVDPGALPRQNAHYRRSKPGLFLEAPETIEAETVQPLPATFFGRIEILRRRRRTRFKALSTPAPKGVDTAVPAGEEYVTAWQQVTALYRRDSQYRRRDVLPYPIDVGQWPAFVIVPTLRRRETARTIQRIPTLSFFEPPQTLLPSYAAKVALLRRGTTYRTSLPIAPQHIFLRVPPDSQSWPAFMAPLVAFKTTRSTHHLFTDVWVLGKASSGILKGLQPPQYIVGRMTEHGVGVIGRLSIHAITVDGRMAPTHAVDGSFDPSEGHEGSML